MGNSVDHDIRILGERNWRYMALNREEWMKPMQGCPANDNDDDD
jgi:hypothetical protein